MGLVSVPRRGVEAVDCGERGELGMVGLFDGEGVRRPEYVSTGLEAGSGCQLFRDRAALWLAVMRRPRLCPARFVEEVLRRGTPVVVAAERRAGRGLLG